MTTFVFYNFFDKIIVSHANSFVQCFFAKTMDKNKITVIMKMIYKK